jgi:hypothetical protein
MAEPAAKPAQTHAPHAKGNLVRIKATFLMMIPQSVVGE